MITGTIPNYVAADHDELTARRVALRDRILMNPSDHLDMFTWFARGMDLVPVSVNTRDCGTVACLCGHGALEMHDRGVTLVRMGAEESAPGVWAVATYYGLDDNVFIVGRWDSVLLSDGRTLADRQGELEHTAGPPWRRVRDIHRELVVEYLDDLIKHD